MEGNRSEGEPAGARRAWPLFVGLALIVLLAVGAVLFAGGGEGASGGAEQAGRPSGGGEAPALGHPSLGSEDAPVVMIEYGDYG